MLLWSSYAKGMSQTNMTAGTLRGGAHSVCQTTCGDFAASLPESGKHGACGKTAS